jgi:hypothetical protein
VVTKLLCVGGPLDGQAYDVDLSALRGTAVTLPYRDGPDDAREARTAVYSLVRVGLFGAAFWVLYNGPQNSQQAAMAKTLLSQEAHQAWLAGASYGD